jgi:hypothetical protein
VKRLIACVSLVAAATTAAVPSTPPAPASHAATAKAPAKPAKAVAKVPKCRIAPADEYFGKLKLSILGIRNTIKDQGLKIDYDPLKADSTLGAIALTEDAIRDWQHKYPCDTWLPGTLYALEHFYLKIHTDDGVKRVHATFAWLRRDYPKSKFVQIARREDGEASALPAGPATAAVQPGAPAPSSAPAAGGAAPIASQAPATPFPGTAPQSVINAQNPNPSPAPSTAPHH